MVVSGPFEELPSSADFFWQSSLHCVSCCLEKNSPQTESKLMKLFQTEEEDITDVCSLLPSDLLEAINFSSETCDTKEPGYPKEPGAGLLATSSSLLFASQSLDCFQKNDLLYRLPNNGSYNDERILAKSHSEPFSITLNLIK